MAAIKIRKVGNYLGIILPKEIQDALELSEGDSFLLTKIANKRFLIESPLYHHSEWKFEGNTKLTTEEQEWLDSDFGDDEHILK